MANKMIIATTANSTSAIATRDKAYFTQSPTRETANPRTPTVLAATKTTVATTKTIEAADPYRQSAHKVVVKRYAVNRG